jgi:hypothetical protein
MAKIVVKIVTQVPSAGGTGGFADYRMLRPFKADVVRLTTDIASSSVSGGVLPITQAEYDLVVA